MKTIILVEDDKAIQDAFTLIFRSGEINIIALESGESILNNEIEAPGLFVLDKNISGVSGVDLCRFIKAHPVYKNVPVILLSASPNLAQVIKECGAEDFIEKPFRIKTVMAVVGKYLP